MARKHLEIRSQYLADGGSEIVANSVWPINPCFQDQDDACGCGSKDCTGDPKDHGGSEPDNDTDSLAIADSGPHQEGK